MPTPLPRRSAPPTGIRAYLTDEEAAEAVGKLRELSAEPA